MTQATIALVLFGWIFIWGVCLAASVGCWHYFKMCDGKRFIGCLILAAVTAIFIMLV